MVICGHGISKDSYCNACTQERKLADLWKPLPPEPAFPVLWPYPALLASYKPPAASEPQVLWPGEWTGAAGAWRQATLMGLLEQAEANRRILYLESVLADFADTIDPVKHPFLAAKLDRIAFS